MSDRGRNSRDAHHLWSAEADDRGRRTLRRSKEENNMFDQEEKKKARRRAASREAAKETVSACWGLWGAGLCDNPTLVEEIPVSVSRAFNAAARSVAPPRIHSWTELRNAFGAEAVQESRKAIANGMHVRMASKYLDVPFLVAAEILDELPQVDRSAVKMAVEAVKSGEHRITADRRGPTLVGKVAAIMSEFEDEGSHRIAIDEAAAAVWKSYFGSYGEEMVRSIKRRVRADLAAKWMTKNGVDEASSEHFSAFFGVHGNDWVKVIPKLISPANQ